ncbi:MAG: hypothetical protein ABIZ71_01350 [Gemmatimonadales bacterium]
MTAQIDLPLSTLPPTAQGAIEAFLIGGGFRYSVEEIPGGLETIALGTIPGFGKLALTFTLWEEGRHLTVGVDHGVRLAGPTRDETLEFLARLNGTTAFCAFGISPTTETVVWKTGYCTDLGSPVTLELVEALLLQLLRSDQKATPCLCRVVEGFESAAEAMEWFWSGL